MTRQRNDNKSTEFGLWLRQQKEISSANYDAQNLDYIWFAYRKGWLILIEEKRYANPLSTRQSKTQRDTHGIIHQALQYASERIFKTLRGSRPLKYKGYFLVEFEQTNPDDSQFIMINRKRCNKADLMHLLKYGELSK